MHLQLHCTPFISYGRSAHAHARHPSPRLVLLSLSPFLPSSSFLFETSLQRAVSFVPLHPASLARARSSPSNFVFSFLLERQTCSASSPLLLLPLCFFCRSERASRSLLFLSPSPRFSHDRLTTRVVSPVLISATRVHRAAPPSLFRTFPPIVHTPA